MRIRLFSAPVFLLAALLLVSGVARATGSGHTEAMLETPRQRAHQLALYMTDALDLTNDQARQLERCAYNHVSQQERPVFRLLNMLPGQKQRAERRYTTALSRILRPSQLTTYLWLQDREPVAAVQLRR